MKNYAILGAIALAALGSYWLNSQSATTNDQVMHNNEIINTAFFYLKEGQEAQFEKLRSRGNVILEKYGARIERVIKPTSLVAGDLELPDEVHFAVYPNLAAKEAFDRDPEFLQLKKDYVASSVSRMFGFITRKDDFEFYREIGDATKTYGIALVYFKDGQQYADQFAEYHDAVCEIIPEFGAHFERFLIPFEAANDVLEQPDEIHRFYFDSPEGMRQMVADSRMQTLFPKRDASLKNLVFMLGEAVQ